ncbi:MAG TPA: M28 family peptidase [Terriglobia bacterium]|nr:M28 family peptidase [Terriglobia bacterium]
MKIIRLSWVLAAFLSVGALSPPLSQLRSLDPAEPPRGRPVVKLLPPPAGAIALKSVDKPSLRATIEELVGCGTRSSLSSWTDPKRGIGCARDHIVARYNAIARESGGRLEVKVDGFDATSPRTHDQPAHMENVYAILPGTDPALAKTVFIVSGHFDSMPSDVMDPNSDAPGADDDASGSAVSIECARLLASKRYFATILFATVSGEEQGLLGGKRLLEFVKENGYTVGAMLDNDIVGADFAPGAPHRVRVFSGSEGQNDGDSPSRELARAVEAIDGRSHIRLIDRVDRLGRGGDHYPFVMARLPAVRFTEPLEDYHHEHQNVREENGIQYGDLIKFLNFDFVATVARDNAEVLRQLASAPPPPQDVTIRGAVTPSAKLSWTAGDDRERAGFELLWRETTGPQWSVFEFVKDVREAELEGVSTDNHFFAVRSVGKSGARSIGVPAEPPRRKQ